ncbi:MAG: enoyl-CoA hydratase-related protein [Burkholderiaceae bacterium]
MSAAQTTEFQFEQVSDSRYLFRINRPAKLNALTKPVLNGLVSAFDTMESNGSAVAVIMGAGDRAFCAGTDLSEIQAMPAAQRLDKNKMARDLFHRISTSPVVSIAAINGLAYGGGLELAMACTFRLAPPAVKLSLPEIKLGLLPAYAGTQFLPALIGRDRALDMIMTGEPITAQAGAQMGLITRLADPDRDLAEQANEWAEKLAQFSQPALRAIRTCVDAAGSAVTEAGLAVEDEQVRAVFQTEDAKEGVAAFLEKRAPRFVNR